MNIFTLIFFFVPADMLKNKVCTEIDSSSSCLNQNLINRDKLLNRKVIWNLEKKITSKAREVWFVYFKLNLHNTKDLHMFFPQKISDYM